MLREMQTAFFAALSLPAITPVHASLMAWDHSRPAQRVAVSHLLDKARRVGVCGDFFFARDGGIDGVEAAALSGHALARDFVATLPTHEQSAL